MNSSVAARILFVPTLVLSLVFLVFGLVTVFWQVPTLGATVLVLAFYLAVLGGASFLTARSTGELVKWQPATGEVNAASVSQVWRSLAMVQCAGAVLMLLLPRAEFWVVLVGSLVLGITGVFTLLMGLRVKNVFPTDKDWRIAGFATVVAAGLLPVVSELGAKAILGVTGGGALIAGIFMFVGALTVRSQGEGNN